MKEIRTIKMVEHTEVKFVADDGTEFMGENAEMDCRDYERTKDIDKVEKAFARLDYKEFYIPFVDFINDTGYSQIVLNSKSDYIAMMDYFNVVRNVYQNDIEEPQAYPCKLTLYEGYDYVCLYKGDIIEQMKKAIEELEK
jgi:hypothetical protein